MSHCSAVQPFVYCEYTDTKIFFPMSSNINYTCNMNPMIKHNPNIAEYFTNVLTSVWVVLVLQNHVSCTPSWLTKLTLMSVWMNIIMMYLKTLSFLTPRIRHRKCHILGQQQSTQNGLIYSSISGQWHKQ
jgi:hypothetical protein